MQDVKKRIVWIDILRIIGIIGVILLHVAGNTINTFGNLSNNAHIFYVFVHYFCSYAVPLFVMISGMMFLGRKDITFKDMFKKYILKILLIIFVIGTGMILMEEIFINKNLSIGLFKTVFLRLIEGDIWAHMWYLYMLLGLYLITPVCILITNNIKESEYKIFLIILFIISILIPTLDKIFGIKIAFNMLNISGYIFYYFYGYFIFNYKTSNKFKLLNYLIALICVGYTIYKAISINDLSDSYSYTTLVPFILASSMILFFKDRNFKGNNLINQIALCSLGIYVLHQFFINIIYKVIKFKMIIDYPYIGLFIYAAVIFICPFLMTYILRKIKFVKKYFL